MSAAPAKRPCSSCPYRRDVPSGVWAAEEYDKLPAYDGEGHEQPLAPFFCHQRDGRLCAGWCGCHDMDDSIGLRMAVAFGTIEQEDYKAALDYVCPVPLWSSGTEAALHGKADIEVPGPAARRRVDQLRRKGLTT